MAAKDRHLHRRVTSVEGISLVPVLPTTLETERPNKTLIGGILYNKGQNLLLVGNQNDRLVTTPIDARKNQDVVASVQDTGRLITLNTFTDITVRQVGLEAVDYQKPESLQRHAPLTIQFNTLDPSTGQSEARTVDEEDILSLVTGERGGIALFSGRGFPEETGLLFESEFGGEKKGTIFFMHPEEKDGVDSINGLHQFLKQVNAILEQDGDIEQQRRALYILGGYENRGKIDYGSHPVRREIFHLLIITLARNAAQGNKIDGQELKSLVPGLKRMIPDSHTPRGYNEQVNQAIAEVIFDSRTALRSEDPKQRSQQGKSQKERKIRGNKPVTDLGVEIKEIFRKANFSGRTQIQIDQFHRTIEWIATAATPSELDDIQRLLPWMIHRFRFSGHNDLPTPDGELIDSVTYDFELQRQIKVRRRETPAKSITRKRVKML